MSRQNRSSALRALRVRLRRFRRRREGVAAIEFAIVLPVLVLMLIGGVELMAYTWATGRVQDASGSVGDLVAQNRTIDEGSLGAIFSAAETMLETDNFTGRSVDSLDVTVTSVIACNCIDDDPDSGFCFTTLWSHRGQGGAFGLGYDQGFELTFVPSTLASAENETVIVTEARYTYSPTIQKVLTNDNYDLSETSYFRPRLTDRVAHTGAQMIDPEPTCATIDTAFD